MAAGLGGCWIALQTLAFFISFYTDGGPSRAQHTSDKFIDPIGEIFTGPKTKLLQKNYLELYHSAKPRWRSPSNVTLPLYNHGIWALLNLLLVSSGDVALNPGPLRGRNSAAHDLNANIAQNNASNSTEENGSVNTQTNNANTQPCPPGLKDNISLDCFSKKGLHFIHVNARSGLHCSLKLQY